MSPKRDEGQGFLNFDTPAPVESKPIADQAQRLRALDPHASFIVQAPAGSGKTELLIQRFLALLSTVDQPESIVAVTFTKKAAGEMRHRVVTALQNAAASETPPEKAHEKQTWTLSRRVLERDREHEWQIVQQPSRLRIQTIDSLCGLLVRQMPWLSRMGAPAEPEDNSSHLYRTAAQATLSLLEDDGPRAAAVERLLKHLDNNVDKAAALLAGMLSRRDHWLRHVAPNKPTEVFRDQLRSGFRQIIGDELKQVRHLFPEDLMLDTVRLARFAAGNLRGQGSPSPLAQCADLNGLPGTAPEDSPLWLGLAEMFLTKEGNRRASLDDRLGFPPSPAGRAMKQRAAATQLPAALIEKLHALRSLPPGEFSEAQWEILAALLELLPLSVAQLMLVFRSGGKVDFTQISHAARLALGTPDSPTDLAFSMDCRIQHLLVDEFQDTSYGQYELLEMLTAGWVPGDGRTVFLVGDPMQSIYGFREAEVGLFLRARSKGIGGIALEPLTLSVNFRSNIGIVNWVNSALGQAFPVEEDIFKGAVTYSASVAFDETAAGVAVHVYPFFDAGMDPEAAAVLGIIREAKKERPEGSIAVLVRSRTHLPAIVKALQRAGQSYRAVEIDALGERPVVQDLLALTGALTHAGDRAAWLAILRAPWCGLTLADLHALVASDVSSAVWDLMQDGARVASLSADGCTRLERIRPVLAAALAVRGRLPLRRWVETTWMALGGPACVHDRVGLEDAATFLDLLEDSSEGADLVNARKFREDVAALFARPDADSESTLQLLTIHKAKGLEFDTVIVPGLGRPTRPEDARLLLWLEYIDLTSETRLLLAPIKETGTENDPTYGYLRRVFGIKASHESTRLLYVAATRARRKLHLLGHVPVDAKTFEVKKPGVRTLLSKIWATVGPAFEHAQAAAGGAGDSVDEIRPATGIPLRRLSAEWPGVPPPADIEWRAPQAQSVRDDGNLDRPPIRFHWAGEVQRRVGIVVHALLQRFDPAKPEWTSAGIAAALSAEGLTGADLAEASRRVELALRATVDDPRGRWVLDRHADDRREYSLTGVVGGRVHHFTLDRTFVDDAGTRWIVDYKTGAHEGGNLQTFLDSEQSRYRDQLESYAAVVAHLDARPIRLGLYFPMLQAWREWEYGGGTR